MKTNLAFVLMLILGCQLQAQVSFTLSSSPGVGNQPWTVEAVDGNGDGKVDLITANGLDNALSVLTNNGSGSFALASSPSAGSTPIWVTSADVSGDSKAELISLNNGNNSLSVLTNNGSGGFAISSTYAVGNNPRVVRAADINGDGKLDLISVNADANTLSVLTNNGSGSFALASSPGVGNNPYSVVAADINGDGKVDLISANLNDNTLSVLTNKGSGGFGLASSPGTGSGPYSVAAADVNGDGKMDLISANVYGNSLSVLTNNGNGGFGLASTLGVGNYPSSVITADVNGDGKVDLINANQFDNTLSVFTNKGSGGFMLAALLPAGSSKPNNVIAVDVNGDGRLDLISANIDGNNLSIFTNATPFLQNTPTCNPAPSGLVSWWRGEGNANDSVGGNNGILMNGAGFAAGEVGQAFNLDGVSQFVQIPDAASLKPTSVTLECWFNASSTVGGSLVAKPVGSGLNDSYQLWLEAGNFSGLICTAGAQGTPARISFTPTPGVWYHAAYTFDSASQIQTLYLNGTPVDSSNSGIQMGYDSHPVYIGSDTDFGSLALPWHGKIDEVSIYNRALSASEIAAIYNAGGAGKCFALVAPTITTQPTNQTVTVGNPASFSVTATGTAPLSYQWVCDGTNILNQTNATLNLSNVQFAQAGNYTVHVSNLIGSTNSIAAKLTVNPLPSCDPAPSGLVAWWRAEGNANDSVGGNNGTLMGGASYVTGMSGQGFYFNGTNADVRVPASASLNVGVGGGFTVEGWINPSDVSQLHPIVEWNNGVDWGVHFYISIDSGPGSLYANIADSGGGWHQMHTSVAPLTTNLFQHVALTYDKTTGVAKIYCMGTLVVQQTLGSFTPNTAYDLYFGRRPPGGADTFIFGGLIDEMSLYNRALSAGEIAAIYNAGSAGKCALVPVAPGITAQPTNQTVTVGDTASFSVTAGGTAPLSYQWVCDGTNILNQTNATLNLSNVQFAQAGNYTVHVSNLIGSTNSIAAKLTVNPLLSCDPAPSGLVAWWRAEGNASNSVGVNNGFVTNGVISYSAGKVGSAFHYNGGGGFVQVPASPSLNVGLSAGFTLEGWIQPGDIINERPLMEWQFDGVQDGVHFWISSVGGAGCLYANVTDTANNSHPFSSPAGILTTNYQHVALTYDKTTGQASIYRNGLLVANSNLGIFTPRTASNLLLGARTYLGDALQFNYVGDLDEMSVYGRALSQSEIAAIYNAGSAGKCDPDNLPLPVPVITAFSPAAGTNGTVITITGTNFSPVAANNTVYFGAVRAAVSAASVTNLTVTMPTGATFVPITETVNGLTAYAPKPFLPTFPGGGQINSSSLAARLDLNLPSATGPGRVLIADIDGDGKPDLIIADSSVAKVSLYRNISTAGSLTAGSFGSRVDLSLSLPSSGSSPFTVATADVDGDGRLDVIALNADSNVVSILRNIGSPGSLTTNSFAARIDLPAATSLRGLAVQDLNGDGKPEIVTASQTSPGGMSIFRNTSSIGNIAFAARVNFVTGNGSASVAIGDLDGDSKPDLVVGNYYGNTLSVFRNLGTGISIATNSFAPGVDFPALANCFSIAIGDMDGDGKLDMLIGGAQNSQAFSVYRNTSTVGSITASSFAARVDFAAPGWVNALALGDLDGDGKLDVAVVSQSPSVFSIFKNVSAPGSFTAASLAARVDYSAGYNPVGVSVGDLDGDGRPDITFGNFYDSTISIYRNLSPFATAPVAPFITVQPTNQTVTVGEAASFSVTAGGTAPLAYQWSCSGTNILGATNATLALSNVQLTQAGGYKVQVSNIAGSTNSSAATLTVNPLPLVPVITAFSPAAGTNGTTITITGTNFSPVAANNTVYFGAVRAAVSAASVTNLTVTMPTGATFVPITETVNGLTAYAPKPFLPTFPGGGQINSSSLAARLDLNLPSATGPGRVLIADIDGDGKPDLIIADSSVAKVSLYRNISTAGSLTAGSFGSRVDLSLSLPSSGSSPFTVATADVDGDGRLDVIALNADSNVVSILRNIGSPGSLTTNSFAARIDLPAATSLRGLAVQDLNGDGKPEIVTASQTSPGGMSIFRNTSSIGNIAFAARVNFVTGNGSASVAIGDLDGDSKPDLVVGNYYGNTLSVFRNLGTGISIATNSFAPGVDFPALANCFSIAIGDMDGDGKLDMLIGGAQNSQAFSVYRNTSTVGSITASSFAARVDFAAPGWVNALALGDLDGDGKLDVAVVSQSPSVFSIFKNVSAPGSFTAASLAARVDYSAGYNPVGVSVGDLDGDGRPDITFGNFYDSTISIYRNLSPFATAPVITSQPTNQIVTVGDEVAFNVTASGTSPLVYQWQFNGTNILGATNTVLTIPDVQLADAGIYSVIVVNPYGSDTSSNAVLTVNRPPVADASATTPLVISVNDSNATVVLDGSLSFDPDGDSLQYFWYQTGASDPLATGIVAVVVLPVGTNSITLLVNDGLATNQNTIAIEVITLAQAVDRLKDAVEDVSHKQSLIASLNAALASIDRSNPAAAINQLQAFQSKVIAQLSPLDPVLAQSLIDAAQSIIDALTGGGSPSQKTIKATAHDNGKIRLNFPGVHQQMYIIEASTNMVDWEKIGVAKDLGDGTFDFDDSDAPRMSARYYRVVVP